MYILYVYVYTWDTEYRQGLLNNISGEKFKARLVGILKIQLITKFTL